MIRRYYGSEYIVVDSDAVLLSHILSHLSVDAVLKLKYVYNNLQLGDIELLIPIQHACQIISPHVFISGNWKELIQESLHSVLSM